METSLIFSKYVTGKYFIGRKTDCDILGNLLRQGENIVIYEPPKAGKTSVVQQTFLGMRMNGSQFTVAECSLLNVRTIADMVMKLGSAVIKPCASNPGEYASLVASYLEGTHFIFDEQIYATRGQILSLNWDIDQNDISAVLTLPYRLSMLLGMKMIVLIDEFQNVLQTEDGEMICKAMENLFKNLNPDMRAAASYILCGSQVNAMKSIFEQKKFFHRCIERVTLSTIDSTVITESMIKVLLTTGKVIDRDLLMGVCNLFKNNIWYINHFISICNALSKGYIMEPLLEEALEEIISIHEPDFRSRMSDLTTYQVCLLRAVIDGHTKFSSSEVIDRYSLNSSANVRRLKDALCKKEILTFGDDDEPIILDPLFEYWVSKYFFEIR